MTTRHRSTDATQYWGHYNRHPTVTSSGLKDHWGAVTRAVFNHGTKVLILRSRYSGRAKPTTAAVAVPYGWWDRQTREHGAPRRADEVRVSHFRQPAPGEPSMSATLDEIEDRGLHLTLLRQRDQVMVLVPPAWYEKVTGVSVTMPS